MSLARVLVVAVAGLAALAFASQVFAVPAVATPGAGAPAASGLAIVVRDQTALRAAPHESAQQQALLWQGELLEVRGERLDHLQVWDHRRERGGFVEASRLRRIADDGADAAELLAVLRFVRTTPGGEALGIGLAAAWLKAASPAAIQGAGGAEAFDAIGVLAERLAQRASAGPAAGLASAAGITNPAPSRADVALAAHLEVAARYGVVFASFERDGAMRICYDGEAFRRVLAMPAADGAARARAALGLTRPECIDPALPVLARQRLDAWCAEVLDRVDTATLPAAWKGRIAARRAGVWSGLAFEHTRRGEAASAEAAARRALAELASIDRNELADDDVAGWNDAALRVGASRWAAWPNAAGGPAPARAVRLVSAPGEPGQTCVALLEAGRPDTTPPLVRRCTWGVAWAASATLNREGNALALAVQPLPGWRELWVFARTAAGTWSVQVLPPSTATPELGYAEFAGWVPGGRQLLVAREARGANGLKRAFEVVRIETLGTERQATDPAVLGPFMRWQDARWKGETVSLR